jgi:hypothetical protein
MELADVFGASKRASSGGTETPAETETDTATRDRGPDRERN